MIAMRRIRREVRHPLYGSLVVELDGETIMVKRKGSRTWLGPVSWAAVYSVAAKSAAEDIIRRKRERRTRKAGA